MAKTLDEAGVKRLIQEIKGANKNLNTPIPISMENTTESMAQNVKNIADYVEKAKAAGIASVNGMAVTCIINNNYSGVGYLYAENTICGIEIDNELEAPVFFVVDPDGTYGENSVLINGLSGQITSDMLVQGARKPIIITGDMTEVDEETYQKLSQEGTDVILNLGGGTFVELQGIFNTGDTLNLIFGYSQFDESNDGVIATYTISINTSAPHTLTLAVIGSCEPVSKSTLSPILQEIDLTGTDADRKTKLDQFEADWKALTGASDLNGARFMGYVTIENGYVTHVLLNYDMDGNYSGICTTDSEESKLKKILVQPGVGSVVSTSLFSHLEAIIIKVDNTPESKAANIAAIEAYKYNLEDLGFDTTKGYMIPITVSGRNGFLSTRSGNYPYAGYVAADSSVSDFYNILILGNGEYYESKIQAENSDELNTISKKLVPAINEVNTLAKSKGNGTITEVRMNGASKGTSGVVDLGTVLTEHQDISGKQDKTDNTLATTDKTVIGAINEINTKVGNLTGALTWKGKLDTLPAVTDYEAGNVISVGNKEYVLTVIGSTKAWEELGDEGSYLLKSAAEKTYAKKTDIPTIPAIPTVNNPKVSIKMNGTEKGSFTLNQASAGEVDLGTVITAHQDISGKVDKTLNAKAFEGIIILTSNTAEALNANKAAVQAYVNNLTELGVDTTKGFNVPVRIDDIFYGCLTSRVINIPGGEGYFLSGTIFYVGDINYIKDICIAPTGWYVELVNIKNDNVLNTTSKDLIGAINEVNTLAKNKQDKLTSGTNIKTINNQSLLGSGNIEISAPSITVDTSMSDTSTNPVQNKVIKAYIDGLVGNVTAQLAQI